MVSTNESVPLFLVITGGVQRHLEEELLIGLPVVVVHDLHGDLDLGLPGGEGVDAVDTDVVLALVSAPIDGVDLDADLVIQLAQPQHRHLQTIDLGHSVKLRTFSEYLMAVLTQELIQN